MKTKEIAAMPEQIDIELQKRAKGEGVSIQKALGIKSSDSVTPVVLPANDTSITQPESPSSQPGLSFFGKKQDEENPIGSIQAPTSEYAALLDARL